jgi:ribokinase
MGEGPMEGATHGSKPVVILGVFVADTTYRADRLPKVGETLLGRSFALGPGGKGSNQAVAAARQGARTHFVTRLGQDAFAEMAFSVWREAGVTPEATRDAASYTGAAFIFVDAETGDNAIIISPGAAAEIGPADIDARAALIRSAGVFMTQLEQPLAAAARGLLIARKAGVTTILNPAPAQALGDDLLGLCDYLTPNETEAADLTGLAVDSEDAARAAADALLARGVGAVVMTLGARGALYHAPGRSVIVPAAAAGPVVETTGAGDAFNGGFAAALARGEDPAEAVRSGCAVAGISVTRAGAAASMPTRAEVEALLAR